MRVSADKLKKRASAPVVAGEEKTAKKTAELLAWLKSKNITPIGTPELARYNPPWTLPFLRRNEVMVAY